MSALVAERVELEKALHRQRVLSRAMREVEREIAAIEAKRTARTRSRAVTSAVARTSMFRDGSPRDLPGHREIARRYAWATYKGKAQPSPAPGQAGSSKLITLIRMRELERIFSARYGAVLPDDDAGRDDLKIVAHHIVHMGSDAERHIVAWAAVWAPWLSAGKATALAARIIAKPVKFSADTLAWRLGLTAEERTRLAVTTIGAIDQNKDQRVKARKLKRQAADRVRRRARGACSRQQYEATSITKARPWESLGISRATWYRRGKPEVAGGSSSQWEDAGVSYGQAGRLNASNLRNSVTKPDVRQVQGQQVSSEAIDSLVPVSPARCGPGGGASLLAAATRSAPPPCPRALKPAKREGRTAPLVHTHPQAQRPIISDAKSTPQPSRSSHPPADRVFKPLWTSSAAGTADLVKRVLPRRRDARGSDRMTSLDGDGLDAKTNLVKEV